MKIIVVGGGKTGATLVHSLSGENHDITVIEPNGDRLRDICNDNDVMGVIGDGLDGTALSEAGLDEADLLIAVTGSDEANLLCSLFAKKNASCDTIARVRNPLFITETEFIRQSIGLSMIVNPEYESANSMARIISLPSAIEINTFFDGRVEMLTFKVGENSVLRGKNLIYVRTQVESEVLFCTVERDGGAFIPSGDFVLKAGDKVSAIINPQKAVEFFKKIGVEHQRVKNVMMAGCGTTGFYLAQQLLEKGIAVTVIESDRARCEELSELLPGALIINGDASDKAVLQEEGIMDMDAFIALTGFDEENIMLSLYVKDSAGCKVITKIDRLAYTELISKLNLDSVIYPRIITEENILKYVRGKDNARGNNVEKLYKLIGDEVEALEFTIGEKAPVVGTPLMNLNLKSELIVCGIFRRGQFIIPNGSSVLRRGDRMIVVTRQKNLKDVGDILN